MLAHYDTLRIHVLYRVRCAFGLQELEGRAKARTWLLPLLRQHARNCQLMYWCTALLPLARQMGSLAAAGGTSMRAMQCRALEAQLWACLPAFASYPTDMPEAFRSAQSLFISSF